MPIRKGLWANAGRYFWQAYRLWLRADCIDLSAAFAYHTLQSFFPALLIALSLASRLLGRDPGLLDRLVDLAGRVLPEGSLSLFEETLRRFTSQGIGAGVLGLVLLLLSASNIYLTLQRGADRLWWNRPFGFDGLPWQELVFRYFRLRLKALGLLFAVGLLIVMDQFVSNVRLFGSSALRGWLLSSLPGPLKWLVTVSFGADVFVTLVISLFAALLFLWSLPSRRVPLRLMLPGAILLSGGFTALNLALARSLWILGIRFQAYGVVGGFLLLTLWVWLVGVVIYFAQCFSVVVVRRQGVGDPYFQA